MKELGSTHEEDIVFLNRKVESLTGPLKHVLADAQRENEALMREIDRTQDTTSLIVSDTLLSKVGAYTSQYQD